MNCELVQRRLLASDAPEEPGAEIHRHLADCPSCRVWQEQLTQLEQQLLLLPTPLSSRKDEMVRQFLNAAEFAPSNGTAPYTPILPFTKPPPRERGLRKASLAIAMAAGLALFALGWWALQQPVAPSPQDPLTQLRVKRDRLLSQTGTQREKVEVVAKLADQHRQEALNLAQEDDAKKLAYTAQFYIELVRDDLPHYAKELAPAQRLKVLPAIADQLQSTESSIRHLLDDNPAKLTKEVRNNLEHMAEEARKSQRQVQAIILRGEA